jgi:lysophospholipase L1-like esterase
MDAIVFPYKPKVLVYYCGSNDLNGGVPPAEILQNFREWTERARERLGGAAQVENPVEPYSLKPAWFQPLSL